MLHALFIGTKDVIMWFLAAIGLPMVVLVVCNVLDYITGIFAAVRAGEAVSSYKSITGITKKISQWALVVVAVVVDILLSYITRPYDTGIVDTIVGGNGTYLISIIVCIWLIANEIISILENINRSGVDVPPFLLPIVKRIAKTQEDRAGGFEDGIKKINTEVEEED